MKWIAYFTLACAGLLPQYALTQAFEYEWAKGVGGFSNYDVGHNTLVDSAGNVYTVGVFGGSVDFDPGPGTFTLNSSGLWDIFIQKLDSTGNFVWAKRIGGSGNDEISGPMALDPQGNLILGGTFTGAVDFDPGSSTAFLSSVGFGDVFLLKLDASGNYVWAKRIGGQQGSEQCTALTMDAFGNIFIAGTLPWPVDFDPGPGTDILTSNGGIDIFIVKYDSSGNYCWARAVGGSGLDRAYTLHTDGSGNILVGGAFVNSVDFDPGPGIAILNGAANEDIFILKLDSAGNYLWAVGMGNPSINRCSSIDSDESGNVYATGYFANTVDFDPGPGTHSLTSDGFLDIYILKLDSAGQFIWAKNFGGPDFESIAFIQRDAIGNLILAGLFRDSTDFDPGPGVFQLTTNGDFDIFIQKLDPAGNFLAVQHVGSPLEDQVVNFSLDHQDNLYLTGYFQDSIDMNPGQTPAILSAVAGNDIFVAKWGKCFSQVSLTDTACKSYTLNDETYTSSGVYTQTLYAADGCDSTITLTLQLFANDTMSVIDTACNSYTFNNETYTSSGIYTQLFTNFNGCDSLILLDLQILPNDTIALVDTACNSYTLNNETYTNSGNFTQILPNQYGCDSVISLSLQIWQEDTTVLVDTACSSYTLNNETYTSSGIYTQLLTDLNGCDSVLSLSLQIQALQATISQTDSSLLASTSAPNLSYQWIDCNNGNVILPGEIGQSFTPSGTGSYAVVVSDGWCVDTSDCIMTSVLSNEPTWEHQLSLYPSPAEQFLTIDWGLSLAEVELQLFSLTGQLLLQSTSRHTSHTKLQLPDLAPGIYMLKVQSEGNMVMRKFLKE